MKKNSSPSSNATKKYSSLNLNTVYKPNGSNRPGQNGRMLLGTVKKGVVKKAPPPTAPKPLNLPSVKKENAGYDPKIALVPAGGSTWNENPAANGHPSTPEAPAPIPMSSVNGPISTTVAPAASPPGPDTSPMSSSPPSSKSVAWGGRGMSKPAPNTTPAPPPQMMPIRPTEDLNRWSRASNSGAGGGNRFGSGGGNSFGGANLQQRMRGKPVEAWPTLAPKEEEAAGCTDTSAANGNYAPTESHELLESKEGDDAWADIDEEMNFDEAENLFDDKKLDNIKPVEEKALSPEEIRALKIAQMEADERRQEEEMQAQQIEDLRREEAEAAAQVAKQQAEERQKQAAEAAARRKEELERKEQEEEAANNAQPVQEHLKEKAQEARERRKREEELANQDRKARADAKLQELEAKKADRVREREAAEEAVRAERRKEEEDRQRQRQEEEQRKWGTSKNVWSAPERQGPSDETLDAIREHSEDNPPSSILKRETSRRTLWQAPTDAEKLKRDPLQRESPRGGREPRSIEQREKEFYNKKFEKITDQGDWRERKKDSQAKEQADLKLKRDQRKKADPKPQKESKAKGEESWRKKPDEKKKEETQPKPSGRTDTRKKEGSTQISLPAPKPKGDGDENSDVKSPSLADADGDADVDTSTSLKVPNDSWAYMKTRKWCEQHGVFKWCESKKIPCSKNSDSKELLLEKVAMWHQALANGEVEPSQKPKRARGSRQRKEKEGSGKSEDAKDEDGDNEDSKKRGSRTRGGAGRGRNRREDAGETDSKGKRRNSVDDAKAESKAPKPPPAGLLLDDQMGLQEIAGGLRVASEGGMVVVDSNETCEDDSGFTTEVRKKEKKDAQKEARALQEKEERARRRREEKEQQKARQESERLKKAAAAAEQASAAAKAAAQSSAPAQNLPQPIGESAPRAHSIQDLAVAGGANVAGAAPAKPAWGGQGQNKTAVQGKGAPNFHDIMLEERFQAKAPPTFPVQPNSPQNFEVPAPHPPHGANTGAVGAERKIPSEVQAADPWANPAPAPAPGVSVGSSAFPLGSGAFTQSTFGSFDRPFDSHGTTLTPSQGVAQFTALPSFGASNHYNNAFSAAPTGLGGWGSANDSLSQQQLPTEAPSNHPSGWSPTPNQKPVGPNKSEGTNSASGAKSSNGGDKHKRTSRGGKGRGSSKGSGKGKGGKVQDAKDGDAGKSDHSRNNNRGGRQNRRGGKVDGGKGGNSNKAGDASASASTSTVDAVVPNKSRRGGGRKGGGSRQDRQQKDSNAKSHESHE